MTLTLPRLGPCGCRRGIERDNCPQCEGTGQAIDWRQYHASKALKDRSQTEDYRLQQAQLAARKLK
jgi:hypothetical protein